MVKKNLQKKLRKLSNFTKMKQLPADLKKNKIMQMVEIEEMKKQNLVYFCNSIQLKKLMHGNYKEMSKLDEGLESGESTSNEENENVYLHIAGSGGVFSKQ